MTGVADLHQPSPISARYQVMTLAVFGVAALVAAVLFSAWRPDEGAARWFWILAGPLLGIAVIMFAKDREERRGYATGPYLGVFAGAIAGCLVLAIALGLSWIVPASFLVVSMMIGFLAWFEQSRVGMTATLVVGILAGVTAASLLGEATGALHGAIGVMLVMAAVALKANFPEADTDLEGQRSNDATLSDFALYQ